MTENEFKIVLVGSAHTGKSSIIQRFVNGQFNPSSRSTVQAGFFKKVIKIEETELSLEIWDTAGQERFHSLTPMYYRDAIATIIVFDVTDANSFAKAKQWVNELRQAQQPNVIYVLVGNKCDLKSIRVVSQTDASDYGESVRIPYLEVSAKTGYNINNIFEEIGVQLIDIKSQTSQLNLSVERNKQKCC
ncbi:ras-related protein Rab-5B [Histomonas meleagridis]|uniref:ras-related protein Rab-5B n=1 Tax=Histomonas meleagridis TaxID=135588 RepID=UPI00355A5B1D|nr:ras-related protein Rab-5B [Histomonas meleagridis]KAH0796495.1 ras-related protein Rab-5B [Histomonas meleagridis]